MAEGHRTAIIGLGIMGRRMLVNMLRHDAFAPVALWDPSDDACRAATEAAPGVAIAESAAAAVAAADVVYLACPPGPRKTLAQQAAGAGKAVFLEKPLGIDLADSRDLVERLAAAGVPAAVNFVQAAGRPLAEIRRAMGAGETGPLVGVDIVVTYPAWPRAWQVAADWLRFRAEGGYTREVISHFVFFAERLLGPTRVVWARPSWPADPALCETHVLARLEAADGTPISILGAVGGAQPDRQEVTVKGMRRSYRILDFYRLLASEGDAFEEVLDRPDDPRAHSLGLQLDALDRCLRGAPHPLATPAEALSVQERIEGILAGA